MRRIISGLLLCLSLLTVSCAAAGNLLNRGGDDSPPADEGASSEDLNQPTLAPTLELLMTLTPDPDAPRDLPSGIPPTYTPDASDGELTSGVPTPEGQISIEFDGEGNLVSEGELHTVAEGETLGEIAELYGVTVEEILSANATNIDNIDQIFPGQVLVIPIE